ncbi:MAG: preprotein translocase subunit SecE [Planctomycetaceae bacterium]|nr:preprotein translocase subunit SecE [Planctomycetaceae bacterium]
MAKANVETTFWGEMLRGRLFKPNQGRVVRQITAVSVALVFISLAWRLSATVLSEQESWARYGGPGLIAIMGCWLGFRLVNWPTFANFLISVEAEMDKVSWASWDYLKRATAVVLVVMVFLGAYLFLCDIFWQQLFGLIGFLDLNALET